LNIIKEKFITKEKVREDSSGKNKGKASESPKTFSELNKSRTSFTGSANSFRKSRLKTEDNLESTTNPSTHGLSPNGTNNNATGLFKELCK
jgi:hypothetical protein